MTVACKVKKILFFETLDFTGATRVTRTLAKAASKNYVVAFAQVGDRVKEDIESAIEKEKPNILFSSFIQINPDVIEVGRSHTLKVIIRNDYNLYDITEDARKRIVETYYQADEIIAQTEEMRNELIQMLDLNPTLVRVLENPLDENDILSKSEAPSPYPQDGLFHFCWVGRYDRIKGVDILLEAFNRVKEIHSSISLYLIGKEMPQSEYYQDILEYVKLHHMQKDVHFVGFDENPYKWMKHSDCFLVPSRSEANSNVQKEAVFLNIQVITTFHLGYSEKENMILFAEPGNAQSLAEQMVYMIDKYDKFKN